MLSSCSGETPTSTQTQTPPPQHLDSQQSSQHHDTFVQTNIPNSHHYKALETAIMNSQWEDVPGLSRGVVPEDHKRFLQTSFGKFDQELHRTVLHFVAYAQPMMGSSNFNPANPRTTGVPDKVRLKTMESLIKLLCNKEKRKEIINMQDIQGYTVPSVMHLAACTCTSPSLIEYLLHQGANVYGRIHNGKTVLHLAAGMLHEDSIRFLLKCLDPQEINLRL